MYNNDQFNFRWSLNYLLVLVVINVDNTICISNYQKYNLRILKKVQVNVVQSFIKITKKRTTKARRTQKCRTRALSIKSPELLNATSIKVPETC